MLHFVLIFPDSGRVWHPNLLQYKNEMKKMSLLQYYQYLLRNRVNQTNSLMKLRILFQQYAVMAWTIIESQKMRYFRQH